LNTKINKISHSHSYKNNINSIGNNEKNSSNNKDNDYIGNKHQKSNNNHSKAFIDQNTTNKTPKDDSHNYSLRQKARLSNVSMNIKQNILNDIMSFSPLANNVSPSPFIISESDKKRLKRKSKSLFDSPILDRFDYEIREKKRNSRSSSEFMEKINSLKEKKCK
jgi:hypothetical protein